ncbi:MAG: amidohydrolase family protein [Caldilineales bacterium]|nr:amidohydrolase family protein [Caldilineales bacterium]
MASSSRPLAIVNCEVFTPGSHIPQGVVLIEGGIIRAVGIGTDIALPPDARLIDGEGGRITPGLIDLVRAASSDDQPETRGVTSYLRALAVVGEAGLNDVREAAAEIRHDSSVRHLGLHLLGPWLPGFGQPPHWRDMWAAADGAIAMITLSARLAGETMLRELAAAGVRLIAVDDDLSQIPSSLSALRPRRVLTRQQHLPLLMTLQDEPDSLITNWQLVESVKHILTGTLTQPLGIGSLAELSAITGADFSSALASATQNPADLLGLPQGRIAPGAPADLLCWTRFGDLAWTMVNGKVRFPAPPLEPIRPRLVPRTQTGDGYIYSMREAKIASRRAAAEITAFLQSQPGHVEVANVEEDAEYQAKDIDLIWRFADARGRTVETAIEIKGDTWANTPNFFFETISNKNKGTPGCFLHTEADWYFYYFIATRTLYCLPMTATRAWFVENLESFREVETSTRVGRGHYKTVGRLVPIADVMAAVPRARKVMVDGVAE